LVYRPAKGPPQNPLLYINQGNEEIIS